MVNYEETQVKNKEESKGSYKRKNKGGYKPRVLRCPYCGEKEEQYLEKRGSQLSCLTCGNDSELYR